MFDVLIADDEALFREYLVTTIDWESYGFRICAQGKNGPEALRLCEELEPDILLTDINMPFMNGLELAEKLREKGLKTSVILLTGHSEFEYAMKAVKLGVADYILKPFEKEELIGTFLKIKYEKAKVLRERNELESNKAFVRENLLNRLISKELDFSEDELARRLQHYDINIVSQFFSVASIEIDDLYRQWTDAADIMLWKFAVSNMLSEIVHAGGNHIIFNDLEGRIVSLLEFGSEAEMKGFNVEMYDRLCRLTRDYLQFTLTIGIGNLCKGLKNIRLSYLQSVSALKSKIAAGNGRVIQYESSKQEFNNIGFYSSEVNESLLLSLRLNNRNSAAEKLNEVFNYIKNEKLSKDFILAIGLGLTSVCLSFLAESRKNIAEAFDSDFSPFEEISRLQSADQLHDWLANLYDRVMLYMARTKTTGSRRMVEAAMEYVEKNYSKCELSVEEIAKNLYINSSYLRPAFKKETGFTVSEYILDFRMKKAKELISSNIKFSEISSLVGYNDAGYFGKSFKKYFGVTPREYENSQG